MKISEFPEYIFWSYCKNSNLPVETIAYNVCLYGDIPDMIKLANTVNKKIIIDVVEKLKKSFRNKKRVFFIEKIILEQ